MGIGDLLLELRAADRAAPLATIQLDRTRLCHVQSKVLAPLSVGLYQLGAALTSVVFESGVTPTVLIILLDGTDHFTAADIEQVQSPTKEHRWRWTVLPQADRLKTTGIAPDLREALQRTLETIFATWTAGRWKPPR